MNTVPLKHLATLCLERRRSEPAAVLTLDLIESGTGRVIGDPWRDASEPPAAGVADVEPGDVVFGKLRPYLAKVLLAREAAYASTELLCLRPSQGANSRWLSYRLLSRPVIDWAVATSEGTRMPRTTWEHLGSLRLHLPNEPEQRAIADFLDAETARIDALIAKKHRLVGSLTEREGAVLDGELRRAARGTVTLRRLLVQPPQYGAAEAGDDGEAEWPRYIRITDLRPDGTLRADDVKRLRPSVAGPNLLKDGDLLFARSGATSGKAFRYSRSLGDACFAGYLIRMRVDRSRVVPELIEFWTQTTHYWGQIREATVQATIQNVNAERHLQLLVPNVAISTQPCLVVRLAKVRTAHASARALLHRQIALLREHRQALITAAVTGDLEIPVVAA